MSTAAVFNQLGQSIMPQVTSSVFPDLMNVYRESTTVGSGGGVIKGGLVEAYEDVPVAYKPMQIENRFNSSDKLISTQQYMLTFPTHDQFQIRIDIDPALHQKFVVLARGNEPEKTFRMVALRDRQGVVFEAVCVKEN